MPYTRVIPRDLFNESKLLKCLGRLALLVHDGQFCDLLTVDAFALEGGGFDIDLDPSRNALFCRNLPFLNGDTRLYLISTYNSKSAYPLFCVTDDDNEIPVFEEDGEVTAEFRSLIDRKSS